MSKKAKKKHAPGYADPIPTGDMPAATSAEFVPAAMPDVKDAAGAGAENTFDFIPDLKGNKFS